MPCEVIIPCQMYWRGMYINQLALEAALMEVTLHFEQQGGVRRGGECLWGTAND
jgi:hypothetical protein